MPMITGRYEYEYKAQAAGYQAICPDTTRTRAGLYPYEYSAQNPEILRVRRVTQFGLTRVEH